MKWKENFFSLILTILACEFFMLIAYEVKMHFFTTKEALIVNAPEDMEDAFSAALKKTDLKNDYKVVITSDEKADISVGYNKEKDGTYTKFAYSPFVIGYDDEKSTYESLKKAKILRKSKYGDFYEFNTLKLVNAVIDGKSLKDLGFPVEITIFVPSENSEYWTTFYDFMLITVNDGSYPEDSGTIEKSQQKIEEFLNSKSVKSVTDFNSQILRTDYFSEGALYIVPEQKVMSLSYEAYRKSSEARIFYPVSTVNINFYLKANTENGKKLLSEIDSSKFFYKLRDTFYRSDAYEEINISSYVKDERDAYSFVSSY